MPGHGAGKARAMRSTAVDRRKTCPSSIRTILRARSRVRPCPASSAAACGDWDAPNRNRPAGSRRAMNLTERSQKAQVPSNRTTEWGTGSSLTRTRHWGLVTGDFGIGGGEAT
jgi:hypothetical protein